MVFQRQVVHEGYLEIHTQGTGEYHRGCLSQVSHRGSAQEIQVKAP